MSSNIESVSGAVLNLRTAFPAYVDGAYAPALQAIRSTNDSGVYAIVDMDTRRVLYVGESHTGNLYDTITRHFRSWKVDPANDRLGRRRGGTTYKRTRVVVCYAITAANVAQDAQYAEIQRLQPRDNSIDGGGIVDNPPDKPARSRKVRRSRGYIN